MTSKQSGSLLVITLWVITILSVLAVAIARYLSLEIRLTKYRLAREEAKTLARSGVYLAMQRLAQDLLDAEPGGKAYDWLGDDWAVPPPGGSGRDPSLWIVPSHADGEVPARFAGQAEIAVVDEERKLDVNTATALQFTQLIGSRDLADAIVDYRDQDHEGPGETPIEGPSPYYPKNGPVVTLEELRDLPGQTDEAFQQLRQFTFAVPGPNPSLTVNINTAPQEVLVAVGLPTLTDAIMAFRAQGHYFTSVAPVVETENPAVPPPFDTANVEFLNARSHLSVTSAIFEITSTGRIQQPAVQHRVEAVVRRSADGVQILAWREG